MVNGASEEPPTQRVYLPGSTTHCLSAFQTASWSCGIRNTTVLVSCGLRWIRGESFERAAGSFDAAYIFSYIELGDLIAFAVARIGDIDSDFYIIAGCR